MDTIKECLCDITFLRLFYWTMVGVAHILLIASFLISRKTRKIYKEAKESFNKAFQMEQESFAQLTKLKDGKQNI